MSSTQFFKSFSDSCDQPLAPCVPPRRRQLLGKDHVKQPFLRNPLRHGLRHAGILMQICQIGVCLQELFEPEWGEESGSGFKSGFSGPWRVVACIVGEEG
jgi:hypothetical protein